MDIFKWKIVASTALTASLSPFVWWGLRIAWDAAGADMPGFQATLSLGAICVSVVIAYVTRTSLN
jgi:hypothetical protein